MPQGRRKVPFSGKAKKEQLKLKKEGKSHLNHPSSSRNHLLLRSQSDDDSDQNELKINHQPNARGRNANRYALQFYRETDSEIKERKELAYHGLEYVDENKLEIHVENFFSKEHNFPKRPVWSFNMSKDALETNENRYFTEYLKNMQEVFGAEKMSFFELNIETWRQLWRVLEMSDVVLIIADARFPALMFPPSLYDHVVKDMHKHMILILNKIDLVPTPLVTAWKNYFNTLYPELKVLLFTTMPGYNLMGQRSDKAGLQIRRRKGRIRMAAEGTKMLLDACKELVGNEVDLSSWEQKIHEESSLDFADDDKPEIEESVIVKNDTSYFEHERFKNNLLTIGCIGQPNVGKSSLMNAIMGKKVVSVSKTPGHTKHFQTIFLTPNVRLCDCPGLVFPSKVSKPLQVLMGSFPIAQLREPFTTVKYLAERLDLPKLLRIKHPENDETWSAMDICDAWAQKRGFFTAKAARLDSYRAANSLLRMSLEGKICLCLTPPGFSGKKEFWSTHPDVDTINWIKASTQEESTNIHKEDSEPSDDENGSTETSERSRPRSDASESESESDLE